MTSSRVVGPALAGLLVTTVGYAWAFFGDGVSYLAVLAFISSVDNNTRPETASNDDVFTDALRSVKRK